jgi:hypothetical protein
MLSKRVSIGNTVHDLLPEEMRLFSLIVGNEINSLSHKSFRTMKVKEESKDKRQREVH